MSVVGGRDGDADNVVRNEQDSITSMVHVLSIIHGYDPIRLAAKPVLTSAYIPESPTSGISTLNLERHAICRILRILQDLKRILFI